MEINVQRVASKVNNRDIEGKDGEKCRCDDQGYCKHETKCKYQHFLQICQKFLEDGKCEARRSCQFRHPRICKYWKHSKEGCRRKKLCKYLHDQHHASISKASGCETSEMKNIEKECPINDVEMPDSETSIRLENTINIKKIDDQEVTIQSKNETIKDLEQSETNPKKENKIIKEEIEKLKRIAIKMHKELKESEAKSGKSI